MAQDGAIRKVCGGNGVWFSIGTVGSLDEYTSRSYASGGPGAGATVGERICPICGYTLETYVNPNSYKEEKYVVTPGGSFGGTKETTTDANSDGTVITFACPICKRNGKDISMTAVKTNYVGGRWR